MCPPPSSLPPPPQNQPPPLPLPPQRQHPPPHRQSPPPQRQSPPPQPPQRQSPTPPQCQSPTPPQRQSPTPPQLPERQSTPPQPPERQSTPPQPPERQSTPPQPPQRQSTPPQRQSPAPQHQSPAPQPQPQPPQNRQSTPPAEQQPPPPSQAQPQLQPQFQTYPPPYPFHYQHLRPKKKSSTLASCVLATSFLIFLTIAAIVTCFILFRPLNPQISVHSMKFPAFTLLNGTANFTFFQYVAVRNPNRYAFSHYDSSLQLFSSSSGPLGFMYIPAGNIAAGKTQFMSATFDVKSFTLPPDVAGSGAGPGPRSGPTLELETKMKLVGSVKVLKVFAHHVEKGAKCRVTIQVSDAAVLGYKC